MEAPTGFGRRVRAGLFEVDLGSGEVHKSGRKVPLQEQPFRVLAMLLERPGEIVTREELQARLWPADTFVGFDEGINTAIRKLRIVFGDSADNPRFIETIPRRGYRFIAPAVPSASRETEHPTTAPSMSGASGTAELPIVQTQPTRRFGGSVLEGVKQHKLGLTAGLVVGLVLLTAAGYGVYAVFTRGRAAVPFQNYTISQITDNAKTQAAIISPDGKYILSEIVDAGMSSLWLHHIPTNSDTQVVAPSEVFYTNFDFSPDGNYFYFRKARNSTLDEFDLYRAPVLGGNPRVVVRDTDSDTGFSPDGKHIAYERGNDPDVGKFQLLIANADGTNEKVVAGGPIGSLHRYVALSPDGERFALTDVVGDAPAPIQLMEVASRKTRDLAAINGFVFLKSIWLPDGHGLLVQYQDVSAGMNHNQIGFISYPNGQFHTITKDTNSYESLSLSADAKTLATVQLKRLFTLYVIPAAGTGANSPTPAMPQQQKGSLTFNWAGNDNFYMAEDRQLVRVSSDGSNKTTLLNNTSITSLSVCPDGRTLLLSLIGQGGGTGTNIWRVSADGANLKQLSHGQRDRSPECSKDSKWAYYVNANASRVNACRLTAGHPRLWLERRFPTR